MRPIRTRSTEKETQNMMNLLKRTALLAAVAGVVFVGMPTPGNAGSFEQPRAGQPGKSAERGEKGDKKAQPKAEIGEMAPAFELTDLSGATFKLEDHRGKIVVIEWFNPDCPLIVKHHVHHKTMAETSAKFKDEGVVWVAINSGAKGKQGAGKDRNEKARKEFEVAYPILLDEEGKVGRMYGAKVTPHMFIIHRDGTLAYDGAIDSDRNARRLGEVNYVDKALSELVRGESVTTAKTDPYGCSVKY
jgi:peroxiredoxin